MLCKKCNSVVRADDGTCRICGQPVRKSTGKKSFSKIATFAMVGVVFVACVVFVVLYLQGSLDLNIFGGQAQQPEIEQQQIHNTESEIGQENDYPELPDYTQPIVDEITRRAALENLHNAVQAYIIQNSALTAFISNHGFLYNHTDGVFVDYSIFLDDDLLELSLAHEKFIFFLRPSDFEPFEEVELPLIEQMTVFIGHETVTGIGLYSVHGYVEIFRENLNTLLLYYIPTYSEVFRPSAHNPLFIQVQALIAAHENTSTIDIRHFAHDENFAFATVSSPDTSHILRHYAFAYNYEVGQFEIIASGLEILRHPVATINNHAPNFNLELLPSFDLNQNSLVPVSSELLSQFYELFGTPSFIAATDWFLYAVLPNGQAVFGNILLTTIDAQPVNGWQAAQSALQDFPGYNPIYILRQE